MAKFASAHDVFAWDTIVHDPSDLSEKKTFVASPECFRVDVGVVNNDLDDCSPLVHLLETASNPSRAEVVEAVAVDLKKGLAIGTVLQSPNSSGWPPLVVAVQRGLSTAVTALLELGVDVESSDPKSGWTSLMFAISVGHEGMVTNLLAHGASPNDFAKPSDWNPLAVAIVQNQESIMSILLDAGANPSILKRRHPNLLETYAGVMDQHHAKRAEKEACKSQKPFCIWVKNPAEYI